jgi:hypothetical protein
VANPGLEVELWMQNGSDPSGINARKQMYRFFSSSGVASIRAKQGKCSMVVYGMIILHDDI